MHEPTDMSRDNKRYPLRYPYRYSNGLSDMTILNEHYGNGFPHGDIRTCHKPGGFHRETSYIR